MFEDDFSSLNEEFWRLINQDDYENNWYHDGNSYIISKSVIKIDSEYTPIDCDNYIVTKEKYPITELSVLTLKIGPHESYNNDTYSVVISEDNTNWTPVWIENFSENNNITSIEEKTIDLSAYSGKDVHIGVRHYYGNGLDGDNVTIDHIKLIGAAPAPAVAKIGDNEYSTFAEALTAANAMTDNVTVEIYGEGEFTDGMELNGSFTSISFVGKAEGAKLTVNQTAGGDYLVAQGKTVAFTDLILDKANPSWQNNSGHMSQYFSLQGGAATYTNCTFPNGACTSGGTATYTGCTFQNSSEYGLWVYDDALVTVDGGTVDSKKGIKVYSEDEGSVTSTLTVQNATFTENVTAKPAVAIGYAESITLIGNTYNNTTGHIELDSGSDADCEGVTFVAKDANGNDIAATLEMKDRSNSSAACGVLVDDKIYTTVTTAAKEVEAGQTVTLLYNTDETVELPMGVILDNNGHTADNVTVAQPFAEHIVLPSQLNENNYNTMFGENTVTDGTNYYVTLQAAVEAVAGNANAKLYCKPGSDVGSLQHAPVTSTLTIYGNDAYVSGGDERDFDLGNTDPNGGKDITADMTLTVKHLDGCGAWGIKSTEHTVNLVFENCDNMGKVFITGTTGTLNITMTGCAFEGVLSEAVYSNADGAITLRKVAFSNLNKAVNLNHKAAGTQTVTIDECTFTNCGNDVSQDQIPVRVLSSVEGGRTILSVENTTFTGTPEGGADILLASGIGLTDANIKTTAANVKEGDAKIKSITAEDVYEYSNAIAQIGDTKYTDIVEAFKAATSGCTIDILTDITVDHTWDCRDYATNGSHSQFKESVTINGNGHTIKFTNEIKDNNWNTVFRFEENATVNNLKIDISEATSAQRVITAKKSLTVDGLTIIGSAKYGIIFGEGATADDLANTYIIVENSNLTGTRRAISDNEGGKDVKSVTIVGNKFTANVYVSANETVTFTNNIVEGAYVDIRSYTTGNTLNVTATGNTLTDNTEDKYNCINAGGTVDAQDDFVVPAKGSNSYAYTKEVDGYVRVWGEGGGNAKESYELKLYSGDTHIATTKLNNVGNIIDGDVYVTWNFFYPQSNDEYWTTTWEEGHPNSAAQPTEVELYIDGTLVATTDAKMSGADDVNPVVWRNLGGVAVANLLGEGTAENPYLIETLQDLKFFRDDVNSYTQDGSNQYKGKYVKLTADIDLNNENWTPIGTNSVGDHQNFLGTFYGEKADGTTPTISNLYVNADGDHLGFFARVGSYAEDCTPTVKNIKFNNVNVSSNTTNGHGGSYVAGVIANAGGNSVVSGIEVTGNVYVEGYGYVGGIVGHGYPDIDKCKVTANEGSYIKCHYWCGGGIIGYAGENGTPITNCSVSGVDIWSAYGGAAAIAGLLQDGNRLENVSASNVEITSNSDYCMGYIAGNGEASIMTEVSVENVTATVNGNPITPTDAVAQIENAIYFNLQEAFNEAQANDEIVVLKNIELTESLTISGKTLTLKLGTYTISDKSTEVLTNNNDVWGLISLKNAANLTIKGTGTIECNYTNVTGGWTGMAYCIDVDNTSKLTVDGGKFINGNGGIQTRGEVIVNDGEFISHNGGTCIMALYSDAKVTVNNGTFKDSVEESDVYTGSGAVWSGFGATVEIKGGTYDFAADPEHGNVVWTLFPAQHAIAGTTGYDINMTVSGGTFVNFNPETDVIIDYSASAGFTFGSVVAEGYKVEENADGTYGVNVDPTYGKVAKIGDVYYETLQGAFEAATTKQTITLISDVTLENTVTVANDKVVTLDLNGKTVSMAYAQDATANHAMISNYGNLTILSSVENGKLSYEYKGANLGTSHAVNTITSEPGSVLTLKSGTVENLTYDQATIAYAIDGLTNGGAGDVTVNIEGGVVTSKRQAVRIFANSTTKTGTLNISGGELTGRVIVQNANTSANKAVLSVTGGTFNANDYKDDVLYVGGSNNATIDIQASVSGGTFKGEITDTNVTGFITGGTFSSDVTKFLAPGYTLLMNDEGTFSATKLFDGLGTEDEPYLINDIDDLIAFRDYVNNGGTTYNAPGVYVALGNNIDMASVNNWTPIGDVKYDSKYVPVDADKVFKGIFNGNNKVISNLTISKTVGGVDTQANVGLFGITGEGAVIKDLTLTNVNINTDGRNVGALAGFAYKATLKNITVNGKIQIEGGNNVSGVAGMTRYHDMSATNVKVVGNEGSTIDGNNIVGGIFAEIAPDGSTQTFKNLSVENVAITGVGGVGGIVGLLTEGAVNTVSVKNVILTGRTDYQGDAMGRIRLGSVAGLMGSTFATITSPTIENVTAKNLDGNAVVLPIIGANYDASSNATEAHIGDTYYSTFKVALGAAQANDVIVLLSNVTTNEITNISNNLTIDGNNKTLNYTGTDRAFQITGGTVEIKDLTVNMPETTPEGSRGINLYNGATNSDINVTLNKVTVNGYKAYAVNIGGGQNNTLTIKNSTLTGYAAINVNSASVGHTINVEGSIMNGKNHNDNFHYGAVVIDGTNENTLNITSSTVTTENLEGVNSEYYQVIVGANCTYSVCEGIEVAVRNVLNENTGLYYIGLADAINEAEEGHTIKLLGNDTPAQTLTIAAGKNITLDLNGKTVSGVCNSGQGHLFMIQNTAKLTVKDSSENKEGKITYAKGTSNTGWTIDLEGDLTLESGTIELTGEGWSIGYAVDVRPNSWGTEYTEGTTFTMNGGKVISSDGAIRVASSSAEGHENVSANFVMKNGEIDAAWDGIFVQQSNEAWDVLNVTIDGGTIKSALNPIRFYGPAATSYVNGEDCVKIALNGGTMTYTGSEERTWLVDNILRLGGGVTTEDFLKDSEVRASATFVENITVAEGYKWVEDNGAYILTACNYVAQIGETKYESLQGAENAALNDETIVLLEDIVLDGMVTFFNSASERMLTLDMNGKTINLCDNWDNTTAKSAFWVCDGLTITGNGTINANPNGENDPWAYAIIVGHRNAGTTEGYSGNLVIENGTFYSDDSSVISVTNGTATINGGTFESAGDMDLNCIDDMYDADKASIIVKGGTFKEFNPENNACEGANTNFCAEGYAALPDLNDNYVVGIKPTATVNNLGITTVAAGDYMVYGNGDNTADMPLSFVMQFLADQDEEDMANSPYADWYGDFVITFTGIENGSFTADGCYLAGHYGSFGWVKVPVDGMTIKEDARYPVMLGVGMGQKYDYICSSVQDFKCALYLTPEILEANPNIKVNLELAIVDNSQGQDAATNALVNNENVYSVTDYEYEADDFMLPVAQIGETTYTSLQKAFDAAQDGDEIVVLDNVTYTKTNGFVNGSYFDGLVYTGDKSFTVDFDGYTITENGEINDYLVYLNNKGEKDNEITFKNGTIAINSESTTTAWAAITVGANSSTKKTTLNLNNMDVVNGNPNSASNQVIRTRNGAIVNLNDETVVTSNGTSYGVVAQTNSTVNINSGAKVVQTNSGTTNGDLVYTAVSGNGIINVYEGATIESDKYGIHNMTSGNTVINIYGGTIIADVAVRLATNGGNNQSAVANITGGTFDGELETYTDAASIIITGGTFSEDPSEYCAEGYGAKQNEDGTYSVIMTSGTQEIALALGWNWFSSYINLSDETGLEKVQNALGTNGVQIKGKFNNNSSSYQDLGNGTSAWIGDFNLSTKQMYMINTSADVTMEISGNIIDHEETIISLGAGWNWISYPMYETVEINEALTNHNTAVDGDAIKTLDKTSFYSSALGKWVGDLTELTPGQGYMYKSTNATSFVYSTGSSRFAKSDAVSENKFWKSNANKFANNMSVIAMLSIDGELVNDNYEIAAFANGECRGSARPIYVEELGQYILFMTIHGENVQELTFKYYDVNYGTVYELNNRINYSNDAVLGSINEPYMFNLGILNIEESTLSDINIYPNPTTTDREINLEATCDKVEVFNALGVKVAEYSNVNSIDAIETAGVYVIRVTIDGNARNCRLVVK